MLISKKTIFVMLFIFAVGLCSGAFFEVCMEGEGKTQLMQLLSSMFSGNSTQSFFAAFWGSLRLWLIMLLIAFAMPFFPPLIVLCPFMPMLRGISVGFASTMLIETFGFKGALYIFGTILPQSLIQLPVICLLLGLSFGVRNKKALRGSVRQYLLYYAAGAAAIFISCLLEVF